MENLSDIQFFGFLTIRNLVLIFHLIGIGVGFGGAIASDFVFTAAIRDWKINRTEYRILKILSRMVWIGLSLLIASGIVLVLLNPELYLDSSKFWAKMTIVAVLTVNGIVFHFKHIPMIGKCLDADLKTHEVFINNSRALFVSGAISMVSWFSALVLGGLRATPFSYGFIMGIYLLVLGLAIGLSLLLCNKLLAKPTGSSV